MSYNDFPPISTQNWYRVSSVKCKRITVPFPFIFRHVVSDDILKEIHVSANLCQEPSVSKLYPHTCNESMTSIFPMSGDFICRSLSNEFNVG